MPPRDHSEYAFDLSRGIWSNGDPAHAPNGFLQEDSINMDYNGLTLRSRGGLSNVFTPHATNTVKRAFRFARSTGSVRYIWLDQNGALWDTGFSVVTPIIAAATAGWGTPTDFSMVSMFDRAYITPHNRASGMAGSNVWVYNPDWTGVTVRQAGLTRPGAWGGGSATAAGGNCEPGVHLVAIAFETTSGFISKISSTVLQFTCSAANRTLNLLNIITGTANVVTKRHVLMTKVIPNFNGDVFSSEWFLAATINDNTTTTLNVSMFDTELVKSMDHLEDMLEAIPAGVCITDYKGSLCVGGENANPGIVRVSIPGDPESMAATDGFINAASADGRGVRNMVERSGSFYIFKTARALVTRDNGLAPNTWPVETVDGALGCECYGVGRLFESGDLSQDVFVVANDDGLYLFDGSFNVRALSHNIKNSWKLSAASRGTKPIQVVVDPFNRKIYCIIYEKDLWVCNYELGLDPDSVRWSWFRIGVAPFFTSTTINCLIAAPPTVASGGLIVGVGNELLGLAQSDGTIQQDTIAGASVNIIWVIRTSATPPAAGIKYHFGEGRGIVTLGGDATVAFVQLFDVDTGRVPVTQSLSGIDYGSFVWLDNLVTGSVYVLFNGVGTSSVTVYQLSAYYKPLWQNKAQ